MKNYPFILAGILILVLITVIMLSYFSSDPVSPRETADPANDPVVDTRPTDREIPKEDIVVEISGAVNRPGVYVLNKESRLYSLIAKAGGYSRTVSYEYISKNLNTVRSLADGEKVYLPFSWDMPDKEIHVVTGDNGSPSSSKPEYVSSPENTSAGDTPQNSWININSCSKEELLEIKGIGEGYSKRILDNRPYSSLDDLYEKTKLPKTVLSELADIVTFD